MLDVLATKDVLCMIDTYFPFLTVVNIGNSSKTSAISFPLSPHPT